MKKIIAYNEVGRAIVSAVKNGIESACSKVINHLSKHSKTVSGPMLTSVASISCNNDAELGKIIAEAYTKVGKDGVVLM